MLIFVSGHYYNNQQFVLWLDEWEFTRSESGPAQQLLLIVRTVDRLTAYTRPRIHHYDVHGEASIPYSVHWYRTTRKQRETQRNVEREIYVIYFFPRFSLFSYRIFLRHENVSRRREFYRDMRERHSIEAGVRKIICMSVYSTARLINANLSSQSLLHGERIHCECVMRLLERARRDTAKIHESHFHRLKIFIYDFIVCAQYSSSLAATSTTKKTLVNIYIWVKICCVRY